MAGQQVVAEIIGDASKWNKASADASAHASSLGGAFGKVGGTVKAAGLLMGGAALAAGAAFIAFGVHSISSAVGQERAWARVKSVFGKSSADVVKWSETNSRAFGVTDDTLELSVSKYVAWAQHAGMSSKEATTAAEAMAKRASEISLATGKSYDEVFAALEKGTQGAVKGVKEFGVSLDKGSIAQYAYSHGIADTGSKLTAAQSALARQGMILQQTTSYTKDAAAMTGGFADSQRKMGVLIDEVQDNIGAAFLKVATAVMPVILAAFRALSDAVTTAMPTIQAIVSGTAAAIGTAFSFVAKNVIPVLQVAFGVISTVVVPALGAAFGWIAKNVIPVVNAAIAFVSTNILPKLQVAFSYISANVIPALGAAFGWIVKNVIPPVSAAFGFIVTSVIPPLAKAFGFIVENVVPAVGAALGWIQKNVIPPLSAAIHVLGTVIGTVFGVIGAVVRAVQPVFSTIFNALGQIIGAFVAAVQRNFAIVGTAIGVLGTVFGALGTIIGRVFGTIAGVVKGAFNLVIGLVNGIIRAIDSIQLHVSIPNPLGGTLASVDWSGFGIRQLPYLHQGGDVPGSGNVLAMLQGGERVISRADVARGGGGGPSVVFNGDFHLYGAGGVDEFMTTLAQRIRLIGATR
jgi:hypothetical protein